MYIAINKSNPNEYHSFTWTEDDKLIINGHEVNPNDWDIVEMERVMEMEIDEAVRQSYNRIFNDGNDDIVELERGEEEPEYDGAGFSEEDRIVNGEYRVIDTQDNNNDDVPWDTQTR